MSDGLSPLSFSEEQRRLGVGVLRQLRPSRHLPHVPDLMAHAVDLKAGSMGDTSAVAGRLARLRRRLWLSPYYREKLGQAGLSPEDLTRLEDLPHFPVLTRAELGARWRDLPGVTLDEGPALELAVAVSSGSTGQAVPVVRTGYDVLHMYAALRFWLEHHRIPVPRRPRVVLLCTLPGGLEYSSRLPHFEGGALHRISTQRPRPLERLRKADPTVLFSDPPGLHWLAHQAESPQPALVLTSAQYFAAEQRRALSTRLSAPVINYYATTELGPIAWECIQEGGRFHTLFPDVWVESLGGELAVTRLRASALPLVRYLPGDAGQVEEGCCRCGFRGRTIVGFRGRRACGFLTPAGDEVDAWGLIWLFKDLPLVGFQLQQTGPQAFELEVDAELPMTLDLFAERLQRALTRMGWSHPTVSIRRVVRPLPQTKPEPFVRRCAGPAAS